MKNLTILLGVLLLSGVAHAQGKHLFILSGQSNMQRLNEKLTFIPAIEGEFGPEQVLIIKDAQGGQPISRWYKGWDPADGGKPGQIGDLYDRLMEKVRPAVQETKFDTVTLLWMQGEADAKGNSGKLYLRSLMGLISQLEADLGRSDLNVVIGRLSDHGLENGQWKTWTEIRAAQEAFVAQHPRAVLVNTDDLNDGMNKRGDRVVNDLHYTPDGYRTFGTRLAEAAIKLVLKSADCESGVASAQ